jgi:mono/diheme cytochrome c family protein
MLTIKNSLISVLFFLSSMQVRNADGQIKENIINNHYNNKSIETQASVHRGGKLAIMICGQCHFGGDGRLSGKLLDEAPKIIGRITAPNITTDTAHGIGKWTVANLDYFLRTGVKPNGKKAFIAMPRFPNMADEDLMSIIYFLKSDSAIAKASSATMQPIKVTMIGNLAARMLSMNFAYPEVKIMKPDSSDLVKTGKYLVNDVFHCFACHSANPARIDILHPEKSTGYLGGGSKLHNSNKEKIISSNLTFDMASGIGNYSLADFRRTLRNGQKKNGKWMSPPMVPYPLLTDNEIEAIFAYLKTVPVIKNKTVLKKVSKNQ